MSGAAAAQGVPLMQQVQSHSLGEEKQTGVLANVSYYLQLILRNK